MNETTRRSWFGKLATAIAAVLVPWKPAKLTAVEQYRQCKASQFITKNSLRVMFGLHPIDEPWAYQPVDVEALCNNEFPWSPLYTGPYTRVFRNGGNGWSEIQWEDMKPGDEVIHFGHTPGCPLLCLKGIVKDLINNTVEFTVMADLAPRK